MINEPDMPVIIERIKQAKKLETDKEVADFLGISRTNFSNKKTLGVIPWEAICRACLHSALNIDWVFTGDGHPFRDDQQQFVAPVAQIDEELLAEISLQIWLALDGEEDEALLAKAASRGALAAHVFNKVAFVKSKKTRSAMIHDQAVTMAEAAKWL